MKKIVEVSDDVSSAYYIDGEKIGEGETGDYNALLRLLGFDLEYNATDLQPEGWPDSLFLIPGIR